MNVSKYRMGTIYLVIFALFSLLVLTIDVKPTGLYLDGEQTYVGLYSLNSYFHNLIGFNKFFYGVSTFIGYFSLFVMVFFIGFYSIQLVKRKHFNLIDKTLAKLMVYYVILVAVYVIFDKLLFINYRPVVLNGKMESSYPSTHVFLSGFVYISALYQVKIYIKSKTLALILSSACCILATACIIARTLSGVHWLTDIFGGILLTLSLLKFYKGELV